MTTTPKQCLIIFLDSFLQLSSGSNTLISSRQADEIFKDTSVWNKLGFREQNSFFFQDTLSAKAGIYVIHKLLKAKLNLKMNLLLLVNPFYNNRSILLTQ